MRHTDSAYTPEITCLRVYVIAALLLTSGIVSTAFAQDIGERDSLRFDTNEVWQIESAGDTVFGIDLWAWTDAPNIGNVKCTYRISTSTGGGMGHDDSLIVVDTFIVDEDRSPSVEEFKRFVLDADYDPSAESHEINGFGSNLFCFVGPFLVQDSLVRVGQLRIKARNLEDLPAEFSIQIDTTTEYWQQTNYFAPNPGMPFTPVLSPKYIEVSNSQAQADAICGDVNESGFVDIDDTMYLVYYIFGGGPAPPSEATANVNCVESVDIDDVIYLANYMFGGGPEPCANCAP